MAVAGIRSHPVMSITSATSSFEPSSVRRPGHSGKVATSDLISWPADDDPCDANWPSCHRLSNAGREDRRRTCRIATLLLLVAYSMYALLLYRVLYTASTKIPLYIVEISWVAVQLVKYQHFHLTALNILLWCENRLLIKTILTMVDEIREEYDFNNSQYQWLGLRRENNAVPAKSSIADNRAIQKTNPNWLALLVFKASKAQN